MGQGQSNDVGRYASTEQLSHELAVKFAKRCFTPLELYSFQDVFKSLADQQDNIAYLKENNIAQFLGIPDILSVSSVIFQMVSYLGAFPFGQDAPIVLGFEQMIIVVVIMTERYQRVFKKGNQDRTNLLFRSLAVYDRHSHNENVKPRNQEDNNRNTEDTSPSSAQVKDFAVDNVANNEEVEDVDSLALAALELLDFIDVVRHSDAPISQASIPSDNFKKLITLLLFIAPLGSQERPYNHSKRLVEEQQLEGLRRTADNILSAFVNVEKCPGVTIQKFNTVIPISLPFLFKGFTPMFENFLFSRKFDFTKQNVSSTNPSLSSCAMVEQPLVPQVGEILDLNLLSQLSFFLPSAMLFRRLRLLYSGSDAGFSMGSFESRVFNWRAPTILLVSGNRISTLPSGGKERVFAETLPPKRFPDSSSSSHLVFGVYISQHWRPTHRNCFGDSDTLLFQLEPVHEVFHASSMNTDYASFTKPPSSHQGISFGCPVPQLKQISGLQTYVSLGAVSLLLDSSFEFGVFTHDYTSGGGAFHNSASRKMNWQDRFDVESLEVWGCGGDIEANQQLERWKWEEREAEARQRISSRTGDTKTDRALLEMAGIIGGDRSGGSMN